MAPSNKTMLFVCLLVAAVAVVVPVAQGQGQGGLIPIAPLLGVIRVRGILNCSVNLSANATAGVTPPLTNATVQLRCGAGNGTLVATATTNNSGFFSILLDPIFITLARLLTGCRVVVATPVASCNATLPLIGNLSSPLQFAGITLAGLLPITNLSPVRFTLIP